MSTIKPNLFALLVGINSYPEGISDLKGALNDVDEFRALLRENFIQNKFDGFKLETLTEGAATKAAIVDTWKEVFKNATKGDVCFFYFAGHGVREETSLKSFKEREIDGRIETLFCADSQKRQKKGPGIDLGKHTTLADKELRYLIHKLTKKGIRVVTIFDCCHSGDNTRDLVEKIPEGARQISRYALVERSYEGFIFSKDKERQAFEGPSLDQELPLGEHVQYSACRDEELAFEKPDKDDNEKYNGVFTRALLKILRKRQGNISFRNLYNQVAYSMPRDEIKWQQPQFFIPFKESSSRHLEFLTFGLMGTPKELSLTYNEGIWSLPLGHLQGIFGNTQVWVYSLGKKNEGIPVKNKKIFLTKTEISFEPWAEHPKEDYMARVEGFAMEPLKIGVADGSEASAELTQCLKALGELPKAQEQGQGPESQEEEAPRSIVGAWGEESPDYELSLRGNEIRLCNPGDTRPVIKPLSLDSTSNLEIADKLSLLHPEFEQMAQWHFLKELDSMNGASSNFGGEFPLELRLFQYANPDKGEEMELYPKNGDFTCHLTEDRGGNPYTQIRLELTNTQSEALYCSLIYLSMDYGIDTGLMDQENGKLEIGKSLHSSKKQGKYITYRFSSSSHILPDKWPAKQDYLKVIVSNQVFSIGDLQKKPLPMHHGIQNRYLSRNLDTGSRGISKFEPFWLVKTYGLRVLNPQHHPLPCELIKDEKKQKECIDKRSA